MQEYVHESFSMKEPAMPRFNSVLRQCLHCSNEFYAQPNMLRRGAGKFCSVPCKRAYYVKSPAERLWEKVDRSGGPDTCWLYTTVTRNVYPIVGYDAGGIKWKGMTAHKLVYILTHGPIPKGLMIRHTCDNRRCCNPKHLLPGTHTDNMQDAKDRKRMAQGERHPRGNRVYQRPKLTVDQVREIRLLHGTVSRRALAERFSVTTRTIDAVVSRRTWKHVT
jgi:hypothetical protein